MNIWKGMNKIIKFFKSMIKYIKKEPQDILLIIGLLLICFQTYQLNIILGNYLLGIILVGIGIYIIKGGE